MDQITATHDSQILPILHEYGVCVCPSVLSNVEADAIRDGMISELEYITGHLDVPFEFNNPQTWKTLHKLYPSHRMIYPFPWELGHSQYVWDVRCNPKIINKFALIYGTKNLVVSYDAIAFYLPPELHPSKKPYQNEKGAEEW